ncbi:MAG TPA: hypothetical protein VK861_07985, partial [Bacteroidales bacterium]|nr:hypothetical protein [Bacteroidales bacterium]
MYAPQDEEDQSPMRNTWNEYHEYLDHSGYASNMMYYRSDSDYDSPDEELTESSLYEEDRELPRQGSAKVEEIRDTPHDPPSRRMEREPVLRTDHSQGRETTDYYATYELPLQAQPGSS